MNRSAWMSSARHVVWAAGLLLVLIAWMSSPACGLAVTGGTGGDDTSGGTGGAAGAGGAGGTGGTQGLCTDTCPYSQDNFCDDGGPMSLSGNCAYGTDCTDCGVRTP